MLSETSKLKIAIIEDEFALVQMYKLKFENEGFEVASAPDGKEGLKIIENFKPDIVLLDLMMPIMSGPEMLKRLREKSWGKDLTVVVLTNLGETQAKESLQGLRADYFIVKSTMTPKDVTNFIKNIINK